MKKAWSVILAIVLVALLLGAVAIGVGYVTGADPARIFSTLEGGPLYNFIQNLILYWNELIAALATI